MLRFRTHSPHGTLVYMGKDGDYVLVEMVDDGRVRAEWNLGAGVASAQTSASRTYADGEWHLVMITRQQRMLRIVVDASDGQLNQLNK
jgi:hypothetical protein